VQYLGRMFASVLAILLGTAIPAQAASLGTGVLPASGTCPANDGTSGAPGGSAQYPNQLNGYATTIHALGCNVAGVDYSVVNLPSLIDWQAIPTQGGNVTINTSTNTVIYTSGSNCIANGIDFSLHGGAAVAFECPNATLENSKFVCGSTCIANITQALIFFLDGGNGGVSTVTNNIIDGGSQAGASCANEATLIVYNPGVVTSTLVMEYNWFRNFSQQVLEMEGSGASSYTLTDKYNLIDEGGFCSGAHLNYVQTSAGTYALDVEFNTAIQEAQVSGGEGFQYYNGNVGTSTMINPTAQYNTLIGLGSVSYFIHGNSHATTDCGSGVSSAVTGTGTAKSNYFDISGSLGAFYPSCTSPNNMWGAWTVDATSNKNMVSGAAISFPP
jgi:hypothetical protein